MKITSPALLGQFWMAKLLLLPLFGTVVNKINRLLPGFGNASVAGANAGTNNTSHNPKQAIQATVGTVSFTFTAAALAPVASINSGLLRISQTSAGVAGTITALKVTASDGTTTKVIYQDALARSANDLVDMVIPFSLDIQATTFVVAITAGVNTSVFDLELTGN